MISWILSRIYEIIDIFLQEKKEIQVSRLEECFVDQTEHYKKELADCELDKVYISTRYTPECKQIIETFKYRSRKKLSRELSPLIFRLFQHFSQVQQGDIVTGIPMYFFHTLKRGYNQSFLLARGFADLADLPFFPLVKKTRYTKHQASLTRDKRLTNLGGAFVFNKRYSRLLGARVILIDDVISTGSTANEVAKTLKCAGAKEVVGLFLASQKTEKEGLDKRKK